MTLYSTASCPMCSLLAQKMDERGIKYEKVTDPEVLEKKGIWHVPILETDDGERYGMGDALKLVTSGVL